MLISSAITLNRSKFFEYLLNIYLTGANLGILRPPKKTKKMSSIKAFIAL
jgi:hypothetical protein